MKKMPRFCGLQDNREKKNNRPRQNPGATTSAFGQRIPPRRHVRVEGAKLRCNMDFAQNCASFFRPVIRESGSGKRKSAVRGGGFPIHSTLFSRC